jgi:hypothetical protein
VEQKTFVFGTPNEPAEEKLGSQKFGLDVSNVISRREVGDPLSGHKARSIQRATP